MKIAALCGIGLVAVCLAATSVRAAPIASSTFDTDSEGWSATGDVHGFQWRPDVGSPPGSIFGIDDVTGDTWAFVAPAKFLGNKAAAYGAALSYDINISARDSSPWVWPDVELVGAGITLNWYHAAPPAGVWTRYDVPLVAGACQRSDGGVATESEVRAVLANLTYLSIQIGRAHV